jgi:hypothetical protein
MFLNLALLCRGLSLAVTGCVRQQIPTRNRFRNCCCVQTSTRAWVRNCSHQIELLVVHLVPLAALTAANDEQHEALRWNHREALSHTFQGRTGTYGCVTYSTLGSEGSTYAADAVANVPDWIMVAIVGADARMAATRTVSMTWNRKCRKVAAEPSLNVSLNSQGPVKPRPGTWERRTINVNGVTSIQRHANTRTGET